MKRKQLEINKESTLMSIEREAIWAPLPNTARAITTHLSYDKKSDRIAYAVSIIGLSFSLDLLF